jgi:rhamnosyltransferase subunit B
MSSVFPTVSASQLSASRRRIVLTTVGSLGDLHPFLALALELRARGHHVSVATSPSYRATVEALGLQFDAVRPDLPALARDRAVMRRIMDLRSGGEYLFKELLMPGLRQSFDDLSAAARDADLLVTHPFSFAGPLVAETLNAQVLNAPTTGLRWVSTALTPMSFLSAHDPPVPARVPAFGRLRALGPGVNGWLLARGEGMTRAWIEPVYQLRADLGLPPGRHPLFGGQHSPQLALALFSPEFGPPQPDWPPQARVTGFVFHDRAPASDETVEDAIIEQAAKAERKAAEYETGASTPSGAAKTFNDNSDAESSNSPNTGSEELSVDIESFLQAGPPPVVFTLGSSAVRDAGNFYEVSVAAAQQLGCRAVLLIGDEDNRPRQPLPDGIAAFGYAPYSQLFPRARAIVHQGGVGTVAQAMRAGVPMLVVPYSHDQPDNAARIVRLGVGRTVRRARYAPALAARELQHLLRDSRYAEKARLLGARIRAEDGVRSACDAIEEHLD